MSFRWPFLVLFLLMNCFAYLALRRTVFRCVDSAERRRRVLLWLHLALLVLNLPLIAFFIRRLDLALLRMSTRVLEVVFYPSTAWLATIIAFFLLGGSPALAAGLFRFAGPLLAWGETE